MKILTASIGAVTVSSLLFFFFWHYDIESGNTSELVHYPPGHVYN